MAELAVSPAGPGLRRCKTLNALRDKARWRYGCPEAKVIMEIPVEIDHSSLGPDEDLTLLVTVVRKHSA